MKTNLKLVAGGVAGMLTAAGLVIGLLVWATAEEASSRGAHAETSYEADAGVATVEMPSMEHELATTTPTPRVAPAPPPEPILEEEPFDPYAPELEADGDVRVRRLIIATGIGGHEPRGAADELVLGEQSRFYAFVDAVNETDEEVALRVTFEPESGESAGHVSLEIPANRPRFRTWAWTRHIYEPGRWQAVVRAPDGHVIARRAFDVVER